MPILKVVKRVQRGTGYKIYVVINEKNETVSEHKTKTEAVQASK